MAVIEAILAVIGLLLLFMLAYSAMVRLPATRPDRTGADVSAPYRDGLLMAARLQQAAQELEQQLYAEAARRAATDPEGSQDGTALNAAR